MKRYIDQLRQHSREGVEAAADTSRTLKDWYDSADGERQGEEFAVTLESLITSELNAENAAVCPSVQGLVGSDYVTFSIGDTNYEYKINYRQEQNYIFQNGPQDAAEHYLEIIKDNVMRDNKKAARTSKAVK